jgi:hypothetical protein
LKPVEKALELRVASSMKSSEPMRAYHNRLRYPQKILSLVESGVERGGVKNEARRQYIVCLTAAFEVFWRDFFRALIDSNDFLPVKPSHLRRSTFTFLDVFEIVGKQLSLGELITCAYIFQSPAAVNQCASELLGIDAFGELRKTQFTIREVARKNRSSKLPTPLESKLPGEVALRELPLIEECFSVRHETVHHTGSRLRISARRLGQFEHAVWLFNSLASMFIEGRAERIRSAKEG